MEKNYYYQKYLYQLEAIQGSRPKLLLHVCCGPCSSAILKDLISYFDITIYYSNSNIFPKEEYDRRFEELKTFVSQFNHDFQQTIAIIEDPYEPISYLSHLIPLQDEKEGGLRCRLCYHLRMNQAYRYAKKHQFDYWTTVLSVSPHKNSLWINEIGESMQDGPTFLYSDFKKNDGYLKSVKMTQAYGMYRQNYCGCIFSYKDMKEREKRKEKVIE